MSPELLVDVSSGVAVLTLNRPAQQNAFTATMADPGRVGAWEEIELRCQAADPERLLVAWLRLLAEYVASRQILFSRFEVRIDGTQLSARASGEQMDLRHRGFPRIAEGPAHGAGGPAHGAGGSLLSVARHGDGWVAQASIEFVPATARAPAP